MTIDELRAKLDEAGELPLEEAMPIVATALNGQTLLLPLVDYNEETGVIQLLTGKDANDVAWVYAYTGEDVMASAGLSGKRYGHFEFLEVVRMAREGNFGGIVVDLADGSNRGIIPDYWLEEIERVLGGN